jgi:hypothetical protein
MCVTVGFNTGFTGISRKSGFIENKKSNRRFPGKSSGGRPSVIERAKFQPFQCLQLYLMAEVKIPEKVNADKFDAILKRMIKHKPAPKKELEGKRKGKKKLKTVL